MFEISMKKVDGSDYVSIIAEKGKAKLEILYFGQDFSVLRTMSGKRSAIASPMGKYFFDYEDVCSHYKQFTEILEDQADMVDSYVGMLGSLKEAKKLLKVKI